MTDKPLLSSLRLPEDIPGLSLSLKQELAQELRDTIIRVVTQNGGHLAPSLGVVELTIALLSCFDPARDPIVWDGSCSRAGPTVSTPCAATAAFPVFPTVRKVPTTISAWGTPPPPFPPLSAWPQHATFEAAGNTWSPSSATARSPEAWRSRR